MAKKVSYSELQAAVSKERLTIEEKLRVLNERVKEAGVEGLGECIGVHRVTVSGWMRGKKLPNRTQAKKLADLASPFITAEELVRVGIPKLMPEIGSKSKSKSKPKPAASVSQKAEDKPEVDEGFDW